MTEVARIRIGRVRMKNGGADVRVLYRDPLPRVTGRIREFQERVQGYDEPPSAFVGIAFWRYDAEPWRPSYVISWDTIDPNLPMPRLFRLAAAEIDSEGVVQMAESRVMHNIGYVPDDTPDESA